MAFVYKSERDISPEIPTATGDIGPGQYLPQGFINTKNRQSKVGFDSNTFRAMKITKDDNPGPGSYTYDDKYEKFVNLLNEKQFKSPSLLKSLELAAPEDLDPFTIIINKEKSKEVAFYSKEKRFKESPNNYIPGPGEYSSIDPKFIVRNSIRKKKKKSPFGGKKSHSLIRKDKTPISPYRIATIPSKNFCYGFDINKKGELYVKDDPDQDVRYEGLKNDSVGPGAYEIAAFNSWKKNFVSWEKQSKGKRNSLFNSQEIPNIENMSINNSNFLEENLKRSEFLKFTNGSPINKKTFMNNLGDMNTNNFIGTKNELIMSNQKNKFQKNKIFKHIREKRQKLLEMKAYRNAVEDDLIDNHILNQDPGPGYYFSELATSSFKPQRIPEKFQYFGSNSLRFSDSNLGAAPEEVGPGAYFKDDNKLASEKLKRFLREKNNFYYNTSNNRDELKKERIDSIEERIGINGIINQHKLTHVEGTPGPGNYEINIENFNKKNTSNLSQFGSLQKRFNDLYTNPTPGPGSYIGIPKVESVNHQKFPIRPKKIPIIEEKNEADMSIFPKEECEESKASPYPPGVGAYNSDVIFSLGYKVAKNVNKFNNSSAPFNTVEKRFAYKIMNPADNIGPGQYYKDQSEKKILQNYLNNSPPFNTSAERKFTSIEKQNYPENGPGSYNLSSYFDWNKKSFNVQFI